MDGNVNQELVQNLPSGPLLAYDISRHPRENHVWRALSLEGQSACADAAMALQRHLKRGRSCRERIVMMTMKASVVVVADWLRSVSRRWLARSVLLSLLSWLGGPTPAAAQ